MTNGTDRAIAPPAIDCRFIQTAQRRVEAMRSNKGDFLEPPVLSDLEEALEQRVQKCELQGENWRNRIYRIELAHRGVVLAKQLVTGTDAMLQYQYEQLRFLAALQIPGLRVPKALALLHAKRLLLTEFAPGKTIEALAAKEGYSVSQFLASAAGEKLAVVLTVDYLRREAAAGRREDFEKYLAAVPDVAPPEHDRLD